MADRNGFVMLRPLLFLILFYNYGDFIILGYAPEGSKGDRKALGRSDRSEIVSKQLLFIFPGVARKAEKSFL